MTHEEEDAIIAQAAAIKSRYYQEAEAKWLVTEDNHKQRPWPRCNNLTCNRTLVCQHSDSQPCQGFDF